MDSEILPLYTKNDPEQSEQLQVTTSNPASYVPIAGKPVVEAPSTKLHVLGPNKTLTTCHFCHSQVKTTIKHTVTTRTHMTAALFATLCALCCLPCCVYCCFDSAKNTDHYCPNCQAYLGTYEK